MMQFRALEIISHIPQVQNNVFYALQLCTDGVTDNPLDIALIPEWK
jgi:hypothetical protein